MLEDEEMMDEGASCGFSQSVEMNTWSIVLHSDQHLVLQEVTSSDGRKKEKKKKKDLFFRSSLQLSILRKEKVVS